MTSNLVSADLSFSFCDILLLWFSWCLVNCSSAGAIEVVNTNFRQSLVFFFFFYLILRAQQVALVVKNLLVNAEDMRQGFDP